MNYSAINSVSDIALKFVIENQESSGSVVVSACIYAALKHLGICSEIVHGVVTCNDVSFFHSWIEIENKIVDVAIFGTLNYKGISHLEAPVIMKCRDEALALGLTYFEKEEVPLEVWENNPVNKMLGASVLKFLDQIEDRKAWVLVCKMLNESPTETLVNKIRGELLYDSM